MLFRVHQPSLYHPLGNSSLHCPPSNPLLTITPSQHSGRIIMPLFSSIWVATISLISHLQQHQPSHSVSTSIISTYPTPMTFLTTAFSSPTHLKIWIPTTNSLIPMLVSSTTVFYSDSPYPVVIIHSEYSIPYAILGS